MRSRLVRALTMSALMAVLLAPLPALAASPGPAGEDTVLRIGTSKEPNTASILVCCVNWLEQTLGYDQLVGKDALGQPVPTFAESWTVSTDAKTWTFKIRPGMTWSDGEPADASDAAFTFNYFLESAGSTNPLFSDLTGNVVSARAPDPLTLVLVLANPSNTPLTARFYILPEHVWKDVAYEDIPTFQADPPIVGTGPFILTKWVHGQYQEYTRNDNYWGEPPRVSKILIQFYQTTDATVAALRAGEIDFTDAVNVAAAEQLSGDPGIKVVDAPWSNFAQLLVNGRPPGPWFEGDTSNGPGGSSKALADPAFREALRFAIDRERLVDAAVAGHGQPGVSAVSPSDTNNFTGLPGVNARFDIEEAKRRLDAAGYIDSNGDGTREDKEGKALAFELLVDQFDPMFNPTGQFISEWFSLIGIKATPTVDASGNRIYSNDFDMAVTGGLATILNRWTYFGGPYDTTDVAEVNARLNELRTAYDAATDPAAQEDLTAQMDREVYETQGNLILFYPNVIQAYRTDRFTGWETLGADRPITNIDLYSVPTFTALTPVGAAAPSASAVAPSSSVSAEPSTAPGSTDPTGSSAILPIVVVAGIVIVAIGALVFRRRRSAV